MKNQGAGGGATDYRDTFTLTPKGERALAEYHAAREAREARKALRADADERRKATEGAVDGKRG